MLSHNFYTRYQDKRYSINTDNCETLKVTLITFQMWYLMSCIEPDSIFK